MVDNYPYISPTLPLHLPYNSLHLPYISHISRYISLVRSARWSITTSPL